MNGDGEKYVGYSVYVDVAIKNLELIMPLLVNACMVTTPNPAAALKLLETGGYQVNLVGGTLNRNTMSLTGKGALEFMDLIELDSAVVEAQHFDPIY